MYARLEAENVGDAVRLVARLGRRLAHGVDKVHARHPLIVGQLDLASEVVQVAQQAGEQLAISRRDIGAHGVDDVLREHGVEAAALFASPWLAIRDCGRRHLVVYF